jgi:PhnB protein
MASQPLRRSAVTPYLCVRGADEAIAFYAKAFGAEEAYRLKEPGGRIGHAEIAIGGAPIMLSDEYPDFGAVAPPTLGGSPVSITLLVADVDAAFAQAISAGCTELRAPRLEFYGDRMAMVACPFGYRWSLNAAVEAVSPEDMQARWTKMLAAGTYE